jgi:enamine deaminase RidA (YjgF/YER057c/UK114 family)
MWFGSLLTVILGRCVAVKTLPLNTDVEIECIAVL